MNGPSQHSGRASRIGTVAGRSELAFTLLELLVVIAIIGVLASLVVGLAPVAGAKMREARLKAQLNDLVTAIESYKARFGVYPPDSYYYDRLNPASSYTDPVKNPLYYELTGVIVTNTSTPSPSGGGYFSTADDNVRLDTGPVMDHFKREGFVNSATRDQRRRLFRHPFKSDQHAQIFRNSKDRGYEQLEVLAVGFATDASGKKGGGFPWPVNDPNQPIPSNPGLNPWRYVSSNPTNNPATFDLWAEIVVRGKKKIVGNWKQ